MKKGKNQDRLFYFLCYALITVLTLCVLYPVIYVVSASISDSDMVAQGKVWLWPVDITLEAYKNVLQRSDIWQGYLNTIFYTVSGTLLNVALTLMCAYPMARKNLKGRSAIMFFFSFTMLFFGGIIPTYILVKGIGILNTRWALILPGAMSVYNMIVCRTFIETNIPTEMLEAAQIDGCSNTQFFFQMVLPLSKSIIAVLVLWYGVAHWNAYFDAFIYLRDTSLYPLQIWLRDVLVQSEALANSDTMVEVNSATIYITLKYSIIVVSSLPLFCVYPFVQKHFQKGVMIGSVKG